MESKLLSKIEAENNVRQLEAELAYTKTRNVFHIYDVEIESLEKQLASKTKYIKSLKRQINDYID
jgi:hypothetical protein